MEQQKPRIGENVAAAQDWKKTGQQLIST